MNELIAALIVVVLMLWLVYDRTRHPRKYIDAYLELEKAIDTVERELALALLPALEKAVRTMQIFIDAMSNCAMQLIDDDGVEK